MEFAGEFETHLTVGLTEFQGIEILQEFARSRGLKCLQILLDRGSVTSQPMLTRRGHGDLADQLEVANALQEELRNLGLIVTRTKIEAAPFNRGIPQSDEDFHEHPESTYFEHHIKLLLDQSTELSALRELAQRHAAHLSRNALATCLNRREKRFVTQRCWSMGHRSAHQRLLQLVSALTTDGYDILEVEEEFVVYDTNLGIDSGWILEGDAK